MAFDVKRCVFCRSDDITRDREDERIVVVACGSCGAVFRVEFDPPDEPDLRGRIELIVDPEDERPPGVSH